VASVAKRALPPEQLLAIGYLSQPNKGGKTMAEIAQECGVTERTLYNWQKEDRFITELNRQSKLNVSGLVPDVVQAMYQTSLTDGNAAAAKLILTMAGVLQERIEVETKSSGDLPDLDDMRRMLEEEAEGEK
jgi:predicted transcriptional regulator